MCNFIFPDEKEKISCIRGQKEREYSRSLPPQLLITQRGRASFLLASSQATQCCGLHPCYRYLHIFQIPDSRQMLKQSFWWTHKYDFLVLGLYFC